MIETTMSTPPRPAAANRLRPIAMGHFKFWRFQLTLLAIGLAVVGLFWLFQGHLALQDIVGPLIFTFVVGNCTYLSALAAVPVYAARSFPWDVVLLLAILIPASIFGGYLSSKEKIADLTVQLLAARACHSGSGLGAKNRAYSEPSETLRPGELTPQRPLPPQRTPVWTSICFSLRLAPLR